MYKKFYFIITNLFKNIIIWNWFQRLIFCILSILVNFFTLFLNGYLKKIIYLKIRFNVAYNDLRKIGQKLFYNILKIFFIQTKILLKNFFKNEYAKPKIFIRITKQVLILDNLSICGTAQWIWVTPYENDLM